MQTNKPSENSAPKYIWSEFATEANYRGIVEDARKPGDLLIHYALPTQQNNSGLYGIYGKIVTREDIMQRLVETIKKESSDLRPVSLAIARAISLFLLENDINESTLPQEFLTSFGKVLEYLKEQLVANVEENMPTTITRLCKYTALLESYVTSYLCSRVDQSNDSNQEYVKINIFNLMAIALMENIELVITQVESVPKTTQTLPSLTPRVTTEARNSEIVNPLQTVFLLKTSTGSYDLLVPRNVDVRHMGSKAVRVSPTSFTHKRNVFPIQRVRINPTLARALLSEFNVEVYAQENGKDTPFEQVTKDNVEKLANEQYILVVLLNLHSLFQAVENSTGLKKSVISQIDKLYKSHDEKVSVKLTRGDYQPSSNKLEAIQSHGARQSLIVRNILKGIQKKNESNFRKQIHDLDELEKDKSIHPEAIAYLRGNLQPDYEETQRTILSQLHDFSTILKALERFDYSSGKFLLLFIAFEELLFSLCDEMIGVEAIAREREANRSLQPPIKDEEIRKKQKAIYDQIHDNKDLNTNVFREIHWTAIYFHQELTKIYSTEFAKSWQELLSFNTDRKITSIVADYSEKAGEFVKNADHSSSSGADKDLSKLTAAERRLKEHQKTNRTVHQLSSLTL